MSLVHSQARFWSNYHKKKHTKIFNVDGIGLVGFVAGSNFIYIGKADVHGEMWEFTANEPIACTMECDDKPLPLMVKKRVDRILFR